MVCTTLENTLDHTHLLKLKTLVSEDYYLDSYFLATFHETAIITK